MHGHPANRYRFPIPIVPIASRRDGFRAAPPPTSLLRSQLQRALLHSPRFMPRCGCRAFVGYQCRGRRPGAIPGLRRSSAPPVSSSNGYNVTSYRAAPVRNCSRIPTTPGLQFSLFFLKVYIIFRADQMQITDLGRNGPHGKLYS